MNAISLVLSTLSASSQISEIVSDRIYLNETDQTQAMPQIILTDVSDAPINDLQSEANTFNERIQIDVHSNQYAQAKEITDLIKAALAAEAGYSAVRISTQKIKDLDTQIHRWMTDYSIWFTTN